VKPNDVSNKASAGVTAFSAWLKQVGRSDTTGWRWVRDGWLTPLNISGKLYLTAQDIAQFEARARNGEFRKAPAGAARRSAEARAARQTADALTSKEVE